MPWKVRLNLSGPSKLILNDQPDALRVVIGIIKRDKKILVGKRPQGKTLSGHWEFPGGKIEEGESSIEALKRELQEELDIDVTTATFWFKHAYTYPDKIVLLDIWNVDQFLGEPKSKENQMLMWVSKSEFKKLKFLEGNVQIIEQLKHTLE
jgi:8-oxo-dGTP diphosphatase